MTFSFPLVSGATIISNFLCIFINHIFPNPSIPLQLASQIPSYGIGIEFSCENNTTLSNHSLPAQLLQWALSQLHVSLIVKVDHPLYCLPSPPDVSSNDSIISTSAWSCPLIIHQAAILPYQSPNSFEFPYFVCRMADPNNSFLSQWLIQAQNIYLTFYSHIQRHNGQLLWPWAIVLNHTNHW